MEKDFQSYKKEYNADDILIDGIFKVAHAMDILDRIRDDIIILTHEYFKRPSTFIVEKYYDYINHLGTLNSFVKNNIIKYIILICNKYFSLFFN